jgi:hypothetical protein
MAIRPYLNDVEAGWLDRLLTGNQSPEAISIRSKLTKAGYKQNQQVMTLTSLFDEGASTTSTTSTTSISLELIMSKMVNDIHLTDDDKQFYYEQTGLRI